MSDLLATLDAVVLESLPDGRFAVRGSIPAWAGQLHGRPLQPDAPIRVDDVFPVLSAFLPDAEAAWCHVPPARVDSEFWTETNTTGAPIHLEAAAVKVGPSRVLVITRNERLFLKSQHLLQRARELRMTHSSLMKEVEQKDILIHAIVHDLAGPLHSIMGVLSLLDEQELSPSAADWVRLATAAAARQREMITEILDVYAAEGGALTRHIGEGVDLAEVLDLVLAERAPVARQRDVRLEMGPRPSPCRIVGEEMRLFRVLTNLVDNALRHSPVEGAVQVSVRNQGEFVVVVIEDHGPGVPPSVLPRLFDKFSRGSDASAGTGFGLFFCRITVENWGGGIGYEPRVDGGARFWIRFKLLATAPSVDARQDRSRSDHGQAAVARR
jgi:signal transduction histidine kinase